MIIGLSGKIGSGKDTAAELIEKQYIYKHKKISDSLYKIVSNLTGSDVDYLKSRKGKSSKAQPFDMTVRELLQNIGMKMREIDEDFWLKLLFHNSGKENIVISDVRFKNEADYIKNNNGILVRLEGNPTDIKIRDNIKNHISEVDLDDYEFDHIIKNNGTIEDLKKSITDIFCKINEQRKNIIK